MAIQISMYAATHPLLMRDQQRLFLTWKQKSCMLRNGHTMPNKLIKNGFLSLNYLRKGLQTHLAMKQGRK